MPATAFDQMLQANDDSSAVPKNDTQFKQEAGKQLRIAKDAETEREGLQKKEEALLSKPPINQNAPKQEDFQTPIADKFSSAGMLVATLGSLLTRHSLTSAANSMAGVLNSYNNGDMVKYRQAYDKWKTDNENAMKMADWEKDNLKTISDLLDKKEKGADSTITLMAKAMGNPTLENAVKMGQVQQYLDSHNENIIKTKKATEEFNLQQDLVQDKIEKYKTENGKEPDKAQMHQFQKDAMQEMGQAKKPSAIKGVMSDEDYEKFKNDPKNAALADAYVTSGGAMTPDLVRGLGKVTVDKLDALQRLGLERHPDADLAANYQKFKGGLAEQTSEERAVGSRVGASRVGAEAVEGAIKLAVDASEKVDRTQYPTLNSIIEAAEKGTGDEPVVDFALKNETLINEFAAARNPRGIPRIADKEQARSDLSIAYSKGQYKTATNAMSQEIANIKHSAATVKENKKPTPNDAAIKHLKDNPELKKDFDDYYGEGMSDKYIGK